jgi:PST family polysaccharide transporter
MEAIDAQQIKKSSVRGVVALTTRTLILQFVAFGATFLLTLYLSPDIFGVFYIVSAVIAFLTYFSDIGLAAALVQKKDAVSDDDLSTTFIIQQGLVLTLVFGSLVASPYIASFYKLDAAGIWLFRALAISFFLSSLKTIPSILLERKLAFEKLVLPQILETVGFYGVAVALAFSGFGITSFTYAVLVRGVVGLIGIYIAQPWMPTFVFSNKSAKHLLRFGIPFQLNSFIALLKDDLLTLYLGKVLPFAQVGYIGWAKKWAEVPLRLIMDSVIRVTFPAFSRMQHDKALLARALEKTIYGLALTILPISVGLLFFIGPMVHLIPRYIKWEPALPSFYFFVGAAALASLSTPLINAINAVGKIKITLQFMIFWTVLTWLFTVALLPLLSFNGFAVALFIIGWSVIFVLWEVKKIAPVVFWPQVRGPLLAALMQGALYMLILQSIPQTWVSLLLVGVLGVILYGGVIFGIEKQKLTTFIQNLRG